MRFEMRIAIRILVVRKERCGQNIAPHTIFLFIRLWRECKQYQPVLTLSAMTGKNIALEGANSFHIKPPINHGNKLISSQARRSQVSAGRTGCE
ncbi:hypothetical protein [Brucella sp. 2716]|uniref:hypothetical protein n=1 Tax=Brucella sp. 2716 TaxID=2975052 RepID=UPI00217CE6C4|nr:hypothetical protein [Brucella sp. 2716]UWF61017.1 hypothetical protein NYO66_13190 [Brucella sp. 2716]